MRGTINIYQLREIAKKIRNGSIERKEVTLSEKPDYVDKAIEEADKLLKKLQRQSQLYK